MKLYLVQHGEAASKEHDPQRPLTDRGRTDVARVAAFAASSGKVTISRISHSGKTRAEQTAGIFADYMQPSQGVHPADGLDPLDTPSVWAERLAGTMEDIMLVGHLPHLSSLAARLLRLDEEKVPVRFRQGGMVCLERDESGVWGVRWMVVPELLAQP